MSGQDQEGIHFLRHPRPTSGTDEEGMNGEAESRKAAVEDVAMLDASEEVGNPTSPLLIRLNSKGETDVGSTVLPETGTSEPMHTDDVKAENLHSSGPLFAAALVNGKEGESTEASVIPLEDVKE